MMEQGGYSVNDNIAPGAFRSRYTNLRWGRLGTSPRRVTSKVRRPCDHAKVLAQTEMPAQRTAARLRATVTLRRALRYPEPVRGRTPDRERAAARLLRRAS